MAEHGKREGQQLGNYRLIRILGRAGFAEVCLGKHLHLSAQVAIKVLQTNVADSEASSFRDSDFFQYLLQQAQHLHPDQS